MKKNYSKLDIRASADWVKDAVIYEIYLRAQTKDADRVVYDVERSIFQHTLSNEGFIIEHRTPTIRLYGVGSGN